MPQVAALHSNRSACYAALSRFDDALLDAEKAAALRPEWSKAHSRVGTALQGLERFEEGIAAYVTAQPAPRPARRALSLAPPRPPLRALALDLALNTSRSRSPCRPRPHQL